jgi:hypothetical protein
MSAADWPVQRHPTYFCWEWQGERDRDGYGRLGRKLAHRAVYEAEVGQIPEGLTLEHRCRNRACVNPMHLKPVGQREQLLMRSWKVRSRVKVLDCGCAWERYGRLTPQGGKVCRRHS